MKFNDYFLTPANQASFEEKLDIAKRNITSARLLKDEITSLTKRGGKPNFPTSTVAQPKESRPSLKEKCNDKEFQTILSEIKALSLDDFTDDELENQILNIISPDNLRFNIIIEKLKLSLYHDIIEYQKIFLHEENELERKSILHEIEILEAKIELIDDLSLEAEPITPPKRTNNIFFLTTPSNNVTIYESLRKNIPSEYYPAFKELLASIKNGTFKNLKKLKKNDFFEVKFYECRILFTILNDDNILVIDAFLKKVNTSIYYKNYLANRIQTYLFQKDYFLSNLNNEAFIKEHNKCYDDIIELLEPKKLTLGGNQNVTNFN